MVGVIHVVIPAKAGIQHCHSVHAKLLDLHSR